MQNYKRLKITAKLRSAIVINNEMFFDGILYSMARGADYLRRYNPRHDVKVRLPIKRKHRVYLASRAYYRILRTDIIHWRKRFEVSKAEKWKDSQKIRTDSTVYKNYNAPMEVVIPKNMELYWIVIGDKDKIEKMLVNVLGIGKKASQGFGVVDSWEVEETTRKGSRRFPVLNRQNKEKRFKGTCYPPYSHTRAIDNIIRRF